MKLVICKRTNLNGETVFIPIMHADDEGEPTDRMAEFEDDEVAEFCGSHILAISSTNLIIDTETSESYTL